MRSSLGLRRISEIDVSQVLRASTPDIYHLQSRLRAWGVPSFSAYPLLLRALTHPSISNWAERILRLPKRSLGPNTLELLGDRVVGVCVAASVHDWIRHDAQQLHQHHDDGDSGSRDVASLGDLETWAVRYGASSLVASLVGNRGLAKVASHVGVEDLLRWEKPLPPAAHRLRLDENGVDVATGLGVNREVNALAAAYEALAAAVYLDGGFDAARGFVQTTLLQNPRDVQRANMGLREYQEMLVAEVARWVGVAAVDVASVGLEAAEADAEPSVPAQQVQCGVFDLEPSVLGENVASPVYYAAVVLRKGVRGDEPVREGDLLSVASHFSIEMARIAAAMQAIQALQGKRPGVTRSSAERKCAKVRLVPTSGELEQPQPVDIDFVVDSDMWDGDGDYARLANVLDRVDVPNMGLFAEWDVGRAEELKQKIHDIYSERKNREQAEQAGVNGKNHDTPRRRRPNKLGSGLICERTIAECLELGERVHASNPLHETHRHFLAPPDRASDICSAVFSTVKRLNEIDGWWQVAELRGYSCVGANVLRLWSVQRSMRDPGQDRSEIVGPCEARMSKGAEVEQFLIAGDGLDYAHYLPRIRKGLVGLGIVVQELGTNTALQWLCGAEVVAGIQRQGSVRSDGASAVGVEDRSERL